MSRVGPPLYLIDWGGVLTSNLFDSFRAYCERAGIDPQTLRGRFGSDPAFRELLIALEKGQLQEPDFERRLAELLEAERGVPGALQDPTLELHDANGGTLATNDNWKEAQQTDLQTTGLAPTDDRESAILAILTQGNYTAIVRGKDNTTGVGLVEVYNVQ